MLTQMRVRGLMFDPPNNYIVVLRSDEGPEVLPIWVGKPEANAISLALENVKLPRPMTHDLIKQVLEAIEAKIISVVITDLKDNTYFAKIHLTYRDAEITVDSRPSDAIALALKAESPIFVASDVIQKHSSEELDRWLENLRPEDFGQHDA
jgi:bifunctional DNase/RNase